MHDILPFLNSSEEAVAIAIVTQTWGSSPRPLGSMMAVSESGKMAGSVSGGCVEGAVIEAALRVIRSGVAEELEFSELKDEDVWAVGLSCGGRIHVAVFPSGHPALVRAAEMAGRREPFGLLISGTELELTEDGSAISYPAPNRLIIVGGVHIAISLIAFAKELGFETILIEPRASFADPQRFPVPPDQIFNAWPNKVFTEKLTVDASTYAVTLTHDPKIDDQAVRLLLASPAPYIGCLGSRTTQAQRKERLLKEGFSENHIARIHGPVGLPIGAKTPSEIALSIMAEIVERARGVRSEE